MNKIAAIVVTYNRKEILIECLRSLVNQDKTDFDILVIDNSSTDGTKEYYDAHIHEARVFYHNTGANLGGAGGFNFGLNLAMKQGYDFFWLMDDDSIAFHTALSGIWNASVHLKEQYGFLCSNVQWLDGSACKMNIPEIANDWLDFTDHIEHQMIPVTKATFVGFFTRREVVKNVGLPIKEFFIWSDDTNYSLRINMRYHSFIVINSVITHKMNHNSSASIITDNSGRDQRYYYAYRNRYYNARMTGKRKRYILEVLTTTVHIIVNSKKKLTKLYYMYTGVLSGFMFKPHIEYVKDKDE